MLVARMALLLAQVTLAKQMQPSLVMFASSGRTAIRSCTPPGTTTAATQMETPEGFGATQALILLNPVKYPFAHLGKMTLLHWQQKRTL